MNNKASKGNLCHFVLRSLAAPCPFSLAWLPYLLCLGGFIINAILYYPLPLSTDPFVLYSQAKSGVIGDWHSPVLAATWSLIIQFYESIGWSKTANIDLLCKDTLWFIYMFLVWFGLLLCLCPSHSFWKNTGDSRKSYLEIGILLLLFIWICTDIFSTAPYFKDRGLPGAYFIAIGCMLNFPKRKYRQIFIGLVVLAFLFYGTAMRHNAIFALAPLLCWFVWLILPQRKFLSVIAAGFVLWIAMLGGIHYVNYGLIKTVRMYPIQELLYLDILQLNSITSHYVPPPNTFGNDFTSPPFEKETFRKGFNSNVLVLRSALQPLTGDFRNGGFRLDRSHIVLYSGEGQKDAVQTTVEHLQTLLPPPEVRREGGWDIRLLDTEYVHTEYPKDIVTLKQAWKDRVFMDMLPYLKYKTRFFYRLCRDSVLSFGRISALHLLPVIALLAAGLLLSRRMLSEQIFPGLMLAWSAVLYIAPLWLCLPAVEPRYLIWFFAASLLSLVYLCSQSKLFGELVQTVRHHLFRKF